MNQNTCRTLIYRWLAGPQAMAVHGEATRRLLRLGRHSLRTAIQFGLLLGVIGLISGCRRAAPTGGFLGGGHGGNCPTFEINVEGVPVICFVGRLTDRGPREAVEHYRYVTNQITFWASRISEDPHDESARGLKDRFAREKWASDVSRPYWDYGMLRYTLISRNGKHLYVATYLDTKTTNELWCAYWGDVTPPRPEFHVKLAEQAKLRLVSKRVSGVSLEALQTTNGVIIPKNVFEFFKNAE